jgi:hypothetical protein
MKTQAIKQGWYSGHVLNPTDAKTGIDVQSLAELLPHGSGIDSDWTIHIQKNGKVRCTSYYHKMNDGGYYVGWVKFSFKVYQTTKSILHPLSGDRFQILHHRGDVVMSDVACRDVDLRNYLDDTIREHLVGFLSYTGTDIVGKDEL